MAHAPIVTIYVAITHSIEMAIENRMGVFVSNGNLWMGSKNNSNAPELNVSPF